MGPSFVGSTSVYIGNTVKTGYKNTLYKNNLDRRIIFPRHTSDFTPISSLDIRINWI